MKIWLIINSIGIIITTGLLYLTIRQVGLILNRLGPMGARSQPDLGPRVGENIASFFIGLLANFKPIKPTLYVFGSDSCGVCSKIRPAVESLVKYWSNKSNIVMVYDGNGKNEHVGNGSVLPLVRTNDLRQKLGVNLVPFAVMVDGNGIVLGKGVVNDVSHVESLLELISK